MIHPMLATLVKEPFDSSEWVFEIKWDGYRALAFKKEEVILLSRNRLSFNERFPSLVEEVKKLPGSFILDGEIVIVDQKGVSRFQLLQNKESPAIYYVFDILFYEGKNLTALPLLERKQILKSLLIKKSLPSIRYSEHISTKGISLFKKAKKKGWEGILAKRKLSPYIQGRSREWLKIKTHLGQEFVIGGFTEPRGGRKKFGSLLIGVYEKGALVFCGHVGGGFNEQLLVDVHKQMKRLVTKNCPFKVTPKPNGKVTWVEPKLVCEVSFAEWTKDGSLRQPIFKGLRLDKPPEKVVREKAI